ncbi:hypothetical protein KZZ52_35950 [Dactylosporangium sp. AC04546]|uniref:hypothetical protein n=1 Tax=Dactylosporangium sp. AC04546 TaxID=2862460 RepID=UPI002E7B9C9A|nr:hypothetical protein [Dactylosporangium sp. AC04546]WVK79362.1 hypothetical protein KZZ52_35950 [Dactylosporangium sp. AC04546]
MEEAGWTSDGDVLLVTDRFDEDAKLWTGRPGGRLREVSLGAVCYAANVMTVFPLPSPRIGLAVSCGGNNPGVMFASFDPQTGGAEPMASVSTAGLVPMSSYYGGAWSESNRSAFIGYMTVGCYGVGTVVDGQVRPLDVTVPLPGGAVALASALPPADGPGCTARVLASSPSLSPHERYLSFFLHLCDPVCYGTMATAEVPAGVDGESHVVVQDRVTGRVDVADARFSRPRGSRCHRRRGARGQCPVRRR